MDIFDEVLGGISLKIINGHSVCHTDSWRETKTKLYHTVWSIRRGDVHISMGGVEYTARVGDVVLFSPGDVYTAWSEGECEFVYVFYNLELGYAGDASVGGVSCVVTSGDIPHLTQDFCRKYTANTGNTKHPGLIAYSIFINYITEVLYAVRLGKCKYFKKRDTGAASTDMQRAIGYMSENFSEGISVKEIAAKFGIGEKYFITSFKAITGMPPKKYLTERRMRLAAELLRERERTVAEVAATLGYSDQYSFSKAFKKHYGEPPSTFR